MLSKQSTFWRNLLCIMLEDVTPVYSLGASNIVAISLVRFIYERVVIGRVLKVMIGIFSTFSEKFVAFVWLSNSVVCFGDNEDPRYSNDFRSFFVRRQSKYCKKSSSFGLRSPPPHIFPEISPWFLVLLQNGPLNFQYTRSFLTFSKSTCFHIISTLFPALFIL